MVKRTLIAAAITLLLPAAAIAQSSWAAWDEAYKQAVANCNAGAPKAKGYMTWRANCFTTAIETYQIPRVRYDMDLWRQMITYRSAIAAREDRGEMSIEDGALAISQYLSQIVSIAQSRHAARAAEARADRAAHAQEQQVWTNMMALGVGMMNSSRSSTCIYGGGMIFCN
jgi:hypothetical protein